MTNAAKLLVTLPDLARILTLPEGAVIHRIEIDGDRLDQVLVVVVEHPSYPECPRGGPLMRIPYDCMPTPPPSSVFDDIRTEMYAAHTKGHSARFYDQGVLVAEIPPPRYAVPPTCSCGVDMHWTGARWVCLRHDCSRARPEPVLLVDIPHNIVL